MDGMGEHGLTVTDVPQSMVPEHWSRFDEKLLSDPTVSTLRGVHAETLQTLATVTHTHRSVMADVTQTPAANLQRSYQHAAKAKAALLDRHERAVRRARETIAAIDDATDRVPDPPAPHMVRMVYDSLSRMTPADRSATIHKALEHDDRATLGAVLMQGPAYLWGLSDAEREMHRDTYRRSRYPEALARREAVERGIELANAAARTLVERIDGLFDHGKLREAENAAAAALKALSHG
jgi:hypothetical protein